MSRGMAFASLLLLGTLLLAAWLGGRAPEPVSLIPTLTGEPEYCLTCHAELDEISPSHPVETFGCVICHGGQPLALEADLAHSTMRGGRNPSDLAVVEASCGGSDCHSGSVEDERHHIQRVSSSLQATYAGAVANIRFTFGDQPDLLARQGVIPANDPNWKHSPTGIDSLEVFAPGADSPAPVLAFAANCLNCHLSAEPPEGDAYARLTGCAACHTQTAGRDLSEPLHRLTTVIPYTQCNTCHNRGNYDLGRMQFQPRQDHPTSRLEDYYQPIAQFTRCEYELDCVDCHTREETMGDGHIYSNQAEFQYVQCRTCHGTLEAPPLTRQITDGNDVALRMAFLNPVLDLQVGDTIVVTEQGEPLWNLRQLPDASFEMLTKVTEVRYPVPLVMGSNCEQDPAQQESRYCHACHAVDR